MGHCEYLAPIALIAGVASLPICLLMALRRYRAGDRTAKTFFTYLGLVPLGMLGAALIFILAPVIEVLAFVADLSHIALWLGRFVAWCFGKSLD